MIDLNTRVSLFAGHVNLPNDYDVAEWSGTLGAFWRDNEGAYHSFAEFQKALGESGFMHLGGGAEPEFTLATLAFLDAPIRA